MQQIPQPLPRSAGAKLYQSVASMSAATWLELGASLEGTLARSTDLLCALRGSTNLQQYLQTISPRGGNSGPCTRVWTAGTIAYRCHTCGLSPSAAICVDCFRASDHEGHDYVMYTSDAGGCCDCGDMSSWCPRGCCPLHRPGQHQGAAAIALPPAEEAVARGVVGCALARLQIALEGCVSRDAGPDLAHMARTAQEHSAAQRLFEWLGQLGQHPSLRTLLCEEVLQPASPSVAMQASSLSATEHLPSEAASVARMLQQQRHELLQRLEQLLPAPGMEGGQANRPLPAIGPAPHSMLYWLVSLVLPLEASVVEELASLLILLLYNVPFKEHFGRVLLAFYPHLGALGKRHAVTKALDRLTVQVFHLEETCVFLAENNQLLDVLLDSLLGVLRRAVGEDGRLNGDSPVVTGRHYLRIASDLHMCLSHPAVVLQLLSPGPGQALFRTKYLEVFRLLEGASPCRRQLGEHVLYETSAHLDTVQLELHVMHMLKQGALHTLLKAAEAGSVQPAAAAQALLFAVHQCLEAVEAAAGPLQAVSEGLSFYSTMLLGQGEMTAHMPLERLAAAFLGGLFHLASISAQPQPYLDAIRCALGRDEHQPEEEREQLVRRWEMCGLAAERVLSWMSQIRHRLWVRNGQQLLRLEAFYTSPYWSDHGQDCDLLAVQALLASTTNLSRSLGRILVDNGTALLFRAGSESLLSEAVAELQELRHPQETLRYCADCLRLLVHVLRERSCWHPTYSPLTLRRALVHVLAVGPHSHSEVCDELPYEQSHSPLFDKTLAEVADYRPPTTASTGQYSLKCECWREFDPFYLHYTPRDLQSALHTAQESGVWQPEWQLQLGMPELPKPMLGLQRMLHHLLRIVWAALLAACVAGGTGGSTGGSHSSGSGGGAGAAEDCALAAINLLSLALQRKAADFAAMVGSEGVNSTGGVPLPETWATPAGFLQKCEEHLAGNMPQRPGIIFLLRVLAGSEAWLGDGSCREASWELKACAAAAAAQAQELLQTARQHVGVQQPAEAAAGPAGAPLADSQTAAGQQAAAAEPLAAAEERGEPGVESRRRRQGKQRQQQMLARMRAQQARAAAALLEEEDGEEAAAEPAIPESATAELLEPSDRMEVDEPSNKQPGPAPTASCQLPAHHPATWETLHAECALCHGGSETAPLGLVAQLAVTELPLLASADPAAPLTPQHPGLPGGAIANLASREAESIGGFPDVGLGPRLSVFDRQPSMHLLCCGHVLHASCLERYRSSWSQRVASGQLVEGYQLLQPSPAAGEYLCPICRRLGNCLLPLAAAPLSSGRSGDVEVGQQLSPPPPLSSQEALEQLTQLLSGEKNWVTAPATTSRQLQLQMQHARTGQSDAAREQQQDQPTELSPEVVEWVPQLGCHAAGVVALCQVVRLTGSKWMLQQQRILDWLKHRASQHEQDPPLWGIPVTPAAESPAAGDPAAAATLSPQAALDRLLQQAADAAQNPDVTPALDTIVQAAAAVVVAMDEQAAEEGLEGEEEGEEPPGGGAAAMIEQLQQQAAAVAEDAAAAQLQGVPPQHLPAVGAVALPVQHWAGRPGSPQREHTDRFWGASMPNSTLLSLLGSGIVQWEVAHRDTACHPGPDIDAAHWRALQSIAQLALAAGAPPSESDTAYGLLQQLRIGGDLSALLNEHDEGAEALAIHEPSILLPTLLQLQMAPQMHTCLHEPFALLFTMFAWLVTAPAQQEDRGLSRSVHAHPASVFEALVAAVFPAVASQAVALACEAAHSPTVAAAAMSDSQPLAHALERAASSLMLPWLRRAALLLNLLSGQQPPPPATSAAATSSVELATAVMRQLRLPPLAAALRSPAAKCFALCRRPASCAALGGTELNIVVGRQRFMVNSPPLPPPPKLLQLPQSYQDWYLALGSQTCSACGQVPLEPAMCLRCGALMCCGSRRCQGLSRQGMCFTHSLACGGGTCCFLLTKLTRLLVIRKNRATFLPSPYVDSHGEEDLRLHRGKPLSLHADRLRHLVQLWRGNAFDFDSHVLHAANYRNELASVY